MCTRDIAILGGPGMANHVEDEDILDEYCVSHITVVCEFKYSGVEHHTTINAPATAATTAAAGSAAASETLMFGMLQSHRCV